MNTDKQKYIDQFCDYVLCHEDEFESYVRNFVEVYKAGHPELKDFFDQATIRMDGMSINIETHKKYRNEQSRLHKAVNRHIEKFPFPLEEDEVNVEEV